MEEKKGFKEFLKSGTGKVVFIAVFYVVFFAVFGIVVALSMDAQSPVFAFVYAAIFAYYGWKSLNRITPNIFLIMPIIGWVIYFTIKFILAYFIGVVIAPFKIAKSVWNKI